jgi:hypothetical protein
VAVSFVAALACGYNRAIKSMIGTRLEGFKKMTFITKLRRLFILTWTLLLAPVATVAHHAYTAEFNTTRPVKLSGVLTKVEWSNPHIWIYLDVKDDKGNVTNWGFSASPPGMLQRRGITKNSLKLGEVLTISGHRAKDGSNNASGNVVTFADGHDARIGQDQALNPTEARPSTGKKQ